MSDLANHLIVKFNKLIIYKIKVIRCRKTY